MSFGVISLLQKATIESAQSLYSDFIKKMGVIFFPSKRKNTERNELNLFVMLMHMQINQMVRFWPKWAFFLAVNIFI